VRSPQDPIRLPVLLLGEAQPWDSPWTPTFAGPYWLPAAIVAVCIALVAVCYLVEVRGLALWRRSLLTLLRSAVIFLVGWMVLGWTWTPYAEELAEIVVLVDDSRSMATEDAPVAERGGAAGRVRDRASEKIFSRAELAKQILTQSPSGSSRAGLIAELRSRFRPRVALFGEKLRWLSQEEAALQRELLAENAEEEATRIGEAIGETLQMQRGRSTAAILVLTDGVQTDGTSLAAAGRLAKGAKTPIYFLGFGDDRPQRDVRIVDLIYSPTAFLGDVLSVEVNLESKGFPKGPMRVALRNGSDGETLAETTAEVGANATTLVRLPIRPMKLGEWRFVVEVEKLDEDANAANNVASGLVQVQEDTVRVFVLDRQPRYDFRYLVDLLGRARKNGDRAAPAFMVRTFLQEGDPELSRQDATSLDAFPTRSQLAEFDVIVIGDVNLT
jgi:hypothetical protein